MCQSNKPSKFDMYAKVQQFYDMTRQPRPVVPVPIDTQRRGRLMQYLLSEIVEFGESTTLADQVCEALDLLYFVFDIFVELGVNPIVPFHAVHKANMNKQWPDGTIHWDYSVIPPRLLKPDGWKSPKEAIETYLAILFKEYERDGK